MTEPVFEIISKKRQNHTQLQHSTASSYNLMFQNYLSQSYGYYSEVFIKKICEKAQNSYEKLRKIHLRKILRQTIQKYMMSDLEIIFFEHFAGLHEWNYESSLIQQFILGQKQNNELNQSNLLKLFLHLVCFFVKTYVGSKQEVLVLIDFHNQNLPYFSELYHIWVASHSQKLFHISPRELNQIYSQYSKSFGEKTQKKDYNQMVDKILDLSTTYSIMPSKQKEEKYKKNQSKSSKQIVSVLSKRNSLRNLQSNFCQQNSLRLDFNELKSNRKDFFLVGTSNILNGKSNILNESTEKIQVKKNEKNIQKIGPKKISLSKKRKIQKDQVNNVAKSFFRGRDINVSVEDIKKNENSIKDIIPNSFLDLNAHSSRIQSLPLPYRNHSNMFGFSTLF